MCVFCKTKCSFTLDLSYNLTVTIISQKYPELYLQVKLVNNCSIPSTHTERQTTDLSVKHSFTLYPSLSPYRQTELQTEKQIHLLRVGWRKFFSCCAVVSVFGSGRKQVLILHTTYVLRVSYHTVVVLCYFFWFWREIVFGVTYVFSNLYQFQLQLI